MKDIKKYNKQYYLEHDGKDRVRLEDIDKKGKNCSGWKGGKQKHTGGYILVWVDLTNLYYKMRNSQNTIFEHRLVMAKHLGRCLKPSELVHHINGVKTDNRIKNLELMSKREHAILNDKTRLRDKLGRYMSFEFAMDN